MLKALIGRKVGMTAMFDDKGNRIPVTLLEMGPCIVTKVKKSDGKDKYNSVQLGFDGLKFNKLNKPMKGVYEKAGLSEGFRVLKEFRVEKTDAFEVGSRISADSIFKENSFVKVIGTSKGCGFTGAMKRHNFSGAVASHGASKVHRKPMSAGATDAARVFKGKRSPGHMGNARVTVRNIEIVKINAVDAAEVQEAKAGGKYIVAVRGAVPGKPNSLVILENM